MAEQGYFMGQDGFVWFVGVVEDRNDPDQLGRARVRCLGFHSDSIVEVLQMRLCMVLATPHLFSLKVVGWLVSLEMLEKNNNQ